MVWHRMLSVGCKRGVRKALLIAATVGMASTAAMAQQASRPVGNTEWYRQDPNASQPAAGQPLQGQPLPGQPVGQPIQQQPVAPMPPQGQPVPAGVPGVFANPVLNPALRPYQMPPVNNPYGGYGSVSGVYPSAEMSSYVSATARAATARALYRQAESELGQAYRAAQRYFDNAAPYKDAIREEREAFAVLTAARTKALASLENDKKYQRLLALREDLAEKLQSGRVHRSLGPDEIVAMANLKMSYATEMRAIEATALANEATVRDGQERLVNAGAMVSQMRQQFEDSLRINPDILMARRNMDDARVAKLTSEAYLRATMVSGSYALDYAYYLYRTPNRYDNQNVGYGGGFYGY